MRCSMLQCDTLRLIQASAIRLPVQLRLTTQHKSVGVLHLAEHGRALDGQRAGSRELATLTNKKRRNCMSVLARDEHHGLRTSGRLQELAVSRCPTTDGNTLGQRGRAVGGHREMRDRVVSTVGCIKRRSVGKDTNGGTVAKQRSERGSRRERMKSIKEIE